MLALLSTSDHIVIKWNSKSRIAKNGNTVEVKVGPLRPTQVDRFGNSLRNYDSSPVLSTVGVDEKADVFLQITNIVKEYFPEKSKSTR